MFRKGRRGPDNCKLAGRCRENAVGHRSSRGKVKARGSLDALVPLVGVGKGRPTLTKRLEAGRSGAFPPRGVENTCHFSPDRRHRYSLVHRWNPLFGDRLILWIGLNPSTADEAQLDPTLTRIATFSKREGFDGFWMANLFALRTPYPAEMMSAADPIGPENDAALLAAARRCERVVAAWGVCGEYQERADAVVRLLSGHELWCLGTTKEGHPRHPLYVAGRQALVRWAPGPPASNTPPVNRGPAA